MPRHVFQLIVSNGLTKEFDLAAAGFNWVSLRVGAEIFHKDVVALAGGHIDIAALPKFLKLRPVNAFALLRDAALLIKMRYPCHFIAVSVKRSR